MSRHADRSRFHHRSLTAPLGEGGMGVVFRARDARLQRDVALKLLPAQFAADPERLARFQREAQLLASLNHLHIAQIYGLEHVEGDRRYDLGPDGRFLMVVPAASEAAAPTTVVVNWSAAFP